MFNIITYTPSKDEWTISQKTFARWANNSNIATSEDIDIDWYEKTHIKSFQYNVAQALQSKEPAFGWCLYIQEIKSLYRSDKLSDPMNRIIDIVIDTRMPEYWDDDIEEYITVLDTLKIVERNHIALDQLQMNDAIFNAILAIQTGHIPDHEDYLRHIVSNDKPIDIISFARSCYILKQEYTARQLSVPWTDYFNEGAWFRISAYSPLVSWLVDLDPSIRNVFDLKSNDLADTVIKHTQPSFYNPHPDGYKLATLSVNPRETDYRAYYLEWSAKLDLTINTNDEYQAECEWLTYLILSGTTQYLQPKTDELEESTAYWLLEQVLKPSFGSMMLSSRPDWPVHLKNIECSVHCKDTEIFEKMIQAVLFHTTTEFQKLYEPEIKQLIDKLNHEKIQTTYRLNAPIKNLQDISILPLWQDKFVHAAWALNYPATITGNNLGFSFLNSAVNSHIEKFDGDATERFIQTTDLLFQHNPTYIKNRQNAINMMHQFDSILSWDILKNLFFPIQHHQEELTLTNDDLVDMQSIL